MPIVRYVHATKQFAPDSYGVMDINLEVEPGELVVITGHTGSGKTTLMKLLTREYTLSEGELYFNENPIHALKSSKLHFHRRQIGVIYQDYRLIKDLTVWENVALPLYIAGKKESEIEQRTSDLLNLIKLPDKHDLFPSQLSGGEAQRVSIARALALGPELIFADEPTGNLDAETSKTIALLLAKINELGTTLMLSTHDLTLLDIFGTERHIQLEKGAIVKDSGRQKGTSTPTPAKTTEVSTSEPKSAPLSEQVEQSESSSTTTTQSSTESSPEPARVHEETDTHEKTEVPTPVAQDEETTIDKPQPPDKAKSVWHRLPLIGTRLQKKSAKRAPPAKAKKETSPSGRPAAKTKKEKPDTKES